MRGFRTMYFDKNKLYILDQRRLPGKLSYVTCRDYRDVARCIKNMTVRGAPAIGVAASFGVYLASLKKTRNVKLLIRHVKAAMGVLSQTRPTARNLFWALERMNHVLEVTSGKMISGKVASDKNPAVGKLRQALLREAKNIYRIEEKTSLLIGEHGKKLVRNKDRILTVCNAGALATVDWGTALSIVYRAKRAGKKVKVFSCETRPLLQGARLTCWELSRNKVKVTLISDFAAGRVIQQKMVDKIITGADRVLLNGDIANKIGTYTLAVLAKRHRIPFYVAVPFSTFDFSLKTLRDIPVEERDRREVLYFNNKPIAPLKVDVYNPAFDCVPGELITAIITEKGIIYPPYKKNIRKFLNRR